MGTLVILAAEAVCKSVGQRAQALRLARNLSQQQLADMAGASLSSIRRLESRGQGTLALLVRVAQALQVVDQLGSLFDQPVQTIAQAEQRAAVARRRRARAPRAKPSTARR